MRGKISVIILYTLKTENRYGLQIIKEIKTLTNGQIDIKLPSLYSTLHKLEDEGYITSYWENSEIGGKRRYSALTDKGKKYLEEHPCDFSEYDKPLKSTANNAPSSLAIQPDFFNTIAHSERQTKLKDIEVDKSNTAEETIPNYSILDYIENEQNSTQNSSMNSLSEQCLASTSGAPENIGCTSISHYDDLNNLNETPTSEKTQTEGEVISSTFTPVYDKTDAVLLSDDEIIPHNKALSLLYKPTTITKNELRDADVDFDGIFGDMIEKDVAKTALFGSPVVNIDEEEKDTTSLSKKIDIFAKDANYSENEIPQDLSSKINIFGSANNEPSQQPGETTKFVLFDNKPSNDSQTSQTENVFEQAVVQTTPSSLPTGVQTQDSPIKKNINEYLMKDKVIVEDKYKANIFLKKCNFNNTEYDFFSAPPKYNENTLTEIEKPQTSKLDIFFRNNSNNVNDIQNVKTLDEFIEDCEENGITVSVYNNGCSSRVKSNFVRANRSNLLTAIITFGVLTLALIAMFFAFKTEESITPLAIMTITIFSISILYPIVCAVYLVKDDKIGIPICNIKKEWIPRSIIFVSIILLTLAFNILNGMNVNNLSKYSPYIIVPIVSSFMVIFDYFVKVIIFKVKLFRD